MKELTPPRPDAWRWRKASYSEANDNSNCVELASTLDAVRDSKNPAGPVLTVRAIPTLLDHIKAGHLHR